MSPHVNPSTTQRRYRVEMEAVRSPWLAAFGVVAAVHLVLNGVSVEPADSITKCLLAPLLLA